MNSENNEGKKHRLNQNKALTKMFIYLASPFASAKFERNSFARARMGIKNRFNPKNFFKKNQ